MSSSTKQQRKSIGRRSIISTDKTFVDENMLEDSDDEREDASQRSSKVVSQKTSISSLNSSELSYSREMFNSQRFIMYKHLFVENKINSKNVWNITIINMLTDLCRKKDIGNFQNVSVAIDIGAKVYGLKVDNVHLDVMKMATTMARAAEEHNESSQDIDCSQMEGGQEESNVGKKKTQRKKRKYTGGPKRTIANDASVLGKIPKLEPTDFTSRIGMETGAVENFFTNVLKQTGDCCSFIIHDENQYLLNDIDESVNCNTKIDINHLLLEQQLKINPSIDNFNFCDTIDPSQSESILQKVVYDETGVPVHQLECSITDDFDSPLDVEGEDLVDEQQQEQFENETITNNLRTTNLPVELPDIRSLNNTVLTVSEYICNPMLRGENGKYIDQIWAGPNHWKLKFIHRRKLRFTGQEEGPKKKVRKKKSVSDELDFTEDVNIEFNHIARINKKRPTSSYNKITLPVQELTNTEISTIIAETMLKPGIYPVEKNKMQQVDCSVEPYNYENLNDSNYCPQPPPSDSFNDDVFNDEVNSLDGKESVVQEQPLCREAPYLKDNLVDAPQMVVTAQLQYALRAKRMDMKKLKRIMFASIEDLKGSNRIDFKHLYELLPEKLLGPERKDLSPHTAFVALLHLCNENGFYLRQESIQSIYVEFKK